MAAWASRMAIIFANALIPVALLVFCSGYFPYKPILPGLANYEADDQRPPAVFDRIILMVVDALRSDFVYSNHSGFQFTQNLIRSGTALPFTAHASSPTVTMPRVKAITTGSVPSFSDVILNIAESESMSTLTHQDTILAQFKRALPGKLLMYGDDTWLTLFPDTFDRADGTTSFFVSDFNEVDNNVTRHIPTELARDDWSVMVLHYLGLDHIGHKSGPKSAHMIPKQREMDSIVEEIYSAMKREKYMHSTLLVLCGDHGMNDGGNHGGSSPGETSPALTFISPKLKKKIVAQSDPPVPSGEFQYYNSVEQSDITPTLAGLTGVPIPLNSLGVFIPEFLDMWDSDTDRLNILLQNTRQILRIVRATFPKHSFDFQSTSTICEKEDPSEVEELQCDWRNAMALVQDETAEHDQVEAALYKFLRRAQDIMSGTAANYKVNMLITGSVIAAMAALTAFALSFQSLRSSGLTGLFLVLVVLGNGAIMFASSFIEEEQQFWYWTTSAWMAYVHIRLVRSPIASKAPYRTAITSLAFAAAARLIRRWNQTGQKFAGAPDIAGAFLPHHPRLLWTLILITYLDCFRGIVARQKSRFGSTALAGAFTVLAAWTTLSGFVFKLAFTAADSPELLDSRVLRFAEAYSGRVSLVTQARIVFSGIMALGAMYMFANRRGHDLKPAIVTPKHKLLHECLSLFLMTQSRATNVPLFLLFRIQAWALASARLGCLETTISSLVLQHMSFFAFGGSNAISSIDLSNAYNGVSSYNVVIVGLLTFLSNWAGAIWWVSATRLIPCHRRWTARDAARRVVFLTLHVAVAVLAVMVSCTILRTHLFVWTVFSPKLLYSMAWATANHVVVNVILADGLSWVG